jgi:flagellar biosynthesis/type III secretory pathway M-ring protein FliF/YscJ
MWIFDSFWFVSYFFVFISIIIIWRPTENNKLYAFSEQISKEENENENENFNEDDELAENDSQNIEMNDLNDDIPEENEKKDDKSGVD